MKNMLTDQQVNQLVPDLDFCNYGRMVTRIVAERMPLLKVCGLCKIANGFPEQGGGTTIEAGTESTGVDGAPSVPSDDDDGDGDGDPDRRSPKKKQPPQFLPALLAFAPLSHYIGFGRSRIYALISQGEFPPPVKIGKSSRWLRVEIDTWMTKQAAARPQQTER